MTPAAAAQSPMVTGPIPGVAYLGGPPRRVALSGRGYSEEEYFVSGTASSYVSDAPSMPEDGRVTAKPASSAPYTTRIIVRRPEDRKKFNGTVLVEWLNVSAGTDGTPEFSFLNRQIVREGYAWVGVSVQKVGLDGMPGMPSVAKPVKAADPARYQKLEHPGDAYSFDIFSQVGRILRGTAKPHPLQSLKPKAIIAMGESQSAFFLVSYVNAIDPIAHVYDGYLIHARGGFGAPLSGMRMDRSDPVLFKAITRFRSDLRVPVLDVQSETDVMILGSLAARQPDSDKFRLWEIAGASHADTYLVNASYLDAEGVDPTLLAAALAPTTQMFGQTLAAPMNSAPQQHYVLNSALEHLNKWIREGSLPPSAPRLGTSSSTALPTLALDPNGNAEGGIRSPWMDAPVAVLSGLGQTGAGFAPLFGTTKAFDSARLQELYPDGREQYLRKFAAATDAAIHAGFILDADRQEIVALAGATYPH